MIEAIIGVVIILTIIKVYIMMYFARRNSKPKVEYIPIKSRCTYHYSNDESGMCRNCGKPANGKPGYYTDGYTMIITRSDGTKEGWIVDNGN